MPKKSTAKKTSGKVKRQDRPPFQHASGRWAKKVNGQFVYLGSVRDDPTGERAQRIWNEQCHGIRAGRRPIIDAEAAPEGVTVKVLCDTFLEAKEALVESGEITKRTWNDYYGTCLKVADALGRQRLVSDLRPADFAYLRTSLAKGRGLIGLRNHMVRVKVIFSWGFKSETIEHAVRYGDSFNPPTSKSLRIERAKKPAKLFEQSALRKIIDHCKGHLEAMVLLGINCGLGNSDCARLKFANLDLKKGWLDFPRPKTGEPRRCKLWPETVKALRTAIAKRPTPKDPDDSQLVFITKYGRPWAKLGSVDNALSSEFSKVLESLDMRREGVNFYSLRHTLQTIGEGAKDHAALRRMMGHVAHASDMASVYRERIEDARLVAVSEYVRRWLYPATVKKRQDRSGNTSLQQ
jgi:integrase